MIEEYDINQHKSRSCLLSITVLNLKHTKIKYFSNFLPSRPTPFFLARYAYATEVKWQTNSILGTSAIVVSCNTHAHSHMEVAYYKVVLLRHAATHSLLHND